MSGPRKFFVDDDISFVREHGSMFASFSPLQNYLYTCGQELSVSKATDSINACLSEKFDIICKQLERIRDSHENGMRYQFAVGDCPMWFISMIVKDMRSVIENTDGVLEFTFGDRKETMISVSF